MRPSAEAAKLGEASLVRATERNGGLKKNLLWKRPGFLVRRLHQIHSAMFFEACSKFGVTPLQYSLLSLLREQPGLDQSSLGWELGIDRSNAFDVIQRLRRAGLIGLKINHLDRRRKITMLTAQGTALLDRLDPVALQAHANLLTGLTRKEQKLLMQMLTKVLIEMNGVGRDFPPSA
jgi:DNA-binding MarR family transcriptional regulator